MERVPLMKQIMSPETQAYSASLLMALTGFLNEWGIVLAALGAAVGWAHAQYRSYRKGKIDEELSEQEKALNRAKLRNEELEAKERELLVAERQIELELEKDELKGFVRRSRKKGA